MSNAMCSSVIIIILLCNSYILQSQTVAVTSLSILVSKRKQEVKRSYCNQIACEIVILYVCMCIL